MQKNTVSLLLAGKKFQVPCSPADEEDLQIAAEAVNCALQKTQGKQPLDIRLLMLSLNLSYELLQADKFSKSLEAEVANALRQVQQLLEEQKSGQDDN